ncbi:helix-turn-helix domain-containing protein [Streptomyces microflavus]|uniref:helix-turn-helix domain-containing protein n=1 Tax=Streptomyces microflavus TaxID=1919 RepID=UPI0036493C32
MANIASCALAAASNVVDAALATAINPEEDRVTATTSDPERWAELGLWISDRRRQLGMDQKQLAELAEVSENTIGNYERGRVPARGKMAAGYLRVEKVLQFAQGSFENVLNGLNPKFAVEGPLDKTLRLRSPEEVDDPRLRAVIPIIQEALQHQALAMVFADLAYRWNASEAAIERFKDAAEDLLVDMVSPGRGPSEVAEMTRELAGEGKHKPGRGDPAAGWEELLAVAGRADSLGDDLRRCRVAAGLSIEELSAKSKIPVKVIARMESDDFSFPGSYMHAPIYLQLLAGSLGVSADPFVDRFTQEKMEQPLRVQKSKEYEEWRAGGGLEKEFPGERPGA